MVAKTALNKVWKKVHNFLIMRLVAEYCRKTLHADLDIIHRIDLRARLLPKKILKDPRSQTLRN